jgi:hypothetical protein
VVHGHERGPPSGEPAFQAIVVTVQQDEVAGTDAERDIGEQLAAVGELLCPGPGDAGHGAGGDDPVVGGMLRPATDAIAGGELGGWPMATSRSLAAPTKLASTSRENTFPAPRRWHSSAAL